MDSSWSAVLDYAHQHGLQFGRDIVFTYGPLGFLTTTSYSDHAASLRLLAGVVLLLVVSSGVCSTAWRLGVVWKWLLIAVFVFVAANLHTTVDVLMDIGLVSWGLLCLVGSGRRLAVSGVCLTALAGFAMLTKTTCLVTAGLSVGVVVCDLTLRGKLKAGLGVVLGFLAVFVFGWVIAGQNLWYLGSFVRGGLAVARGYNQTMGTEVPLRVVWGGGAIALAALAVTAVRALTAYGASENNVRWRRGLLLCWLVAFLFITWKHAFVRADRCHIEYFLFFVPVLVLLLEGVPSQRAVPKELARSLGALCCVLAAFTLQMIFFPGYLEFCLRRPLRLAIHNLNHLARPGDFSRRMTSELESERRRAQLPGLRAIVGPASADVFGSAQAYAVFNSFNYRPRPVFQSYTAYTPGLMRENDRFYLSSKAPEYVFFTLSSLDDRFPSLDDATLLRHLLMNYELVGGEGPFLLLKAKHRTPAALTLLRERTVRPGEPINLADFGETNLWMEIGLAPTLIGQIRQFLYKPAKVHLKIWGGPHTARAAEFGAPAPMLEAGFVASPFLLGNGDIVDLYTGAPVARPRAYSLELGPEARPFWQDQARVRIFKIESQLGKSAPQELQRLRYPGFTAAPADVVSSANNIVIDKGKALLRYPGLKLELVDILSDSNAVLRVEGKPAVLVRPGGYMRFTVPEKATTATGGYGFASSSYFSGATEGAEFRIEGQTLGGSLQLFHSQMLKPLSNTADRGLKTFSVTLPSGGDRTLILRTLSGPRGPQDCDLTCWAEIQFH